MAFSSILLTEEQVLCSICLDVLTKPVSTPCGHNFCMACITGYWDTTDQCHCPICKEEFNTRPKLRVNIFIADMVTQLKMADGDDRLPWAPTQALARPGLVTCDVCTGPKPNAVKSCLVCLASSCDQGQSSVSERENALREQRDKLMRVKKDAVDVTLDPDTAHCKLLLSANRKQVRLGRRDQNLPDNPERFDYSVSVLGKNGWSSGRFYYEILVKEKTRWVLGVVRESVNRKGPVLRSPENGHWAIGLQGEAGYKAHAGPDVVLSLGQKPQKVGVFVDCEEGEVSFYDVGAKSCIYSFTGCSFTERLFPCFSTGVNDDGKNSAPLIIGPVSHMI